jgi:hypothetical protein
VRQRLRRIFILAASLWSIPILLLAQGQPTEPREVRDHADHAFDGLKHSSGQPLSYPSTGGAQINEVSDDKYSADRYWIGKGQGDLGKGKSVCQRVSELSARTDLAKQIRVMVKEHLIDRVRERGGRESEQDIELTREEIVEEYLQGVKIVNRQVDEQNKICTATAVMPKTPIQPKYTPGLDPAPAVTK